MFNDPLFKPFIPSGQDTILSFMHKSKDCTQILEKYKEHIDKFDFLMKLQGVERLLSVKIDEHGEFIHQPFTETLKTLTA